MLGRTSSISPNSTKTVPQRAMYAKAIMAIAGSSLPYVLFVTSKIWWRSSAWREMRSLASTDLSSIAVCSLATLELQSGLITVDGDWIQTIIDDKLYLLASDWWESTDAEKATFAAVNRQDTAEKYRLANQTGSKSLYFAQCSNENETWLPLLEKAFAKAHGDFGSINGGFTGYVVFP